MLWRKHVSFLPILSINVWRHRFYLPAAISELESSTVSPNLRRMLGGGLAQVTSMQREKVFSRRVLHFGAACDKCEPRENSSGISTNYFCMAPFPAKQTFLGAVCLQHRTSCPLSGLQILPLSCAAGKEGKPSFALHSTPENNHKPKHRLPSTLSAQQFKRLKSAFVFRMWFMWRLCCIMFTTSCILSVLRTMPSSNFCMENKISDASELQMCLERSSF